MKVGENGDVEVIPFCLLYLLNLKLLNEGLFLPLKLPFKNNKEFLSMQN
jgi:hypothetical protein